MRTYKGKGPKILILLIVCVLIGSFSIGFSAISHSLLIKPHASIKPETVVGSFNVKFSTTSSGVNIGSVTPTTTPTGLTATNAEITGDTTISNFSVELNNPGDVIKYEFYAINDGTAPAYLTSIILGDKKCSPIYGSTEIDASTLCDYIDLSVQVGDITTTTSTSVTEHPLAGASSEKVTITISFKAGLSEAQLIQLGDIVVEFGDISLIYTQVDGDNNTSDTLPCSLSNLDGSIDIGDVVTCGTESFYVMPNHENADVGTVSMLAKYNLNVGEYLYDATEGIQNENVLGDIGTENRYGTVFFSNTSLNWTYDSYPVFVYSNEIDISDYVEGYETYLKSNLGVTSADATLASYNQLFGENGLGCTYEESCGNAPEWVYSTTYWTGIAYSEHEVVYIESSGAASYDDHASAAWDGIGVRPVVIVDESQIEK